MITAAVQADDHGGRVAAYAVRLQPFSTAREREVTADLLVKNEPRLASVPFSLHSLPFHGVTGWACCWTFRHQALRRLLRAPRTSAQILGLSNLDRVPLPRPFGHFLPSASSCRFHTVPAGTTKICQLHAPQLPPITSGRCGCCKSCRIGRTRPPRSFQAPSS